MTSSDSEHSSRHHARELRALLPREASRARLAAPSPLLRRWRLLGPATLLLVLAAALAAAATQSPARAQDAGEPPARPAEFTVTVEPGLLNVNLDWSDVDGAAEYWLRWRSVDKGERLSSGVRLPLSETTLAMPDYGTWVVRVQACNDAGCGKPTSQRFTVEALTPPGAPANLAVSATPGELDLSASWDALDGATSYRLSWRQVGGGFEADNAATVTETSAGFTVDGFGQWLVRLEGCNNAGCGGPGRQVVTIEQPNRAPQVDTGSAGYSSFAGSGPAPRGVLVTKPFDGIFSDPDGDQLTYHLSAVSGPLELVEQLGIFPDGVSDAAVAESERSLSPMRVYFEANAGDDWDSVLPPVADTPVVTVTLTATDPDGLTASVQGSFEIRWERQPDDEACELTAPSSVSGLGIERGAVISWALPEDLDDACQVSGFVVGAASDSGARLEDRVTDPEARRHVMRWLDPGDYHFYVRIEYAEGTSEELVALQQMVVPETCDIIVTAEPYAATMISGRWRTNQTTPTGCVAGPTIEFQFKRSQDDFYHSYGTFPNWPQPDPDLPAFIIANLEPYVSYDFKIVAVNAAGDRGESNVATATIVSNDPSVAADANSPLNLRVFANSNSGITVAWDRPASFGAGRSFSAWVVEWSMLDDDGRVASTDTTTLANLSTTRHRIVSLVDGKRYVVRVAARTTDSASNTHDAWSAPAPVVTVWSEPLQAWFYHTDHDTVWYAHGNERVWVAVTANRLVSTAVCHVNTDSTRCPPGTLVNIESAASDSPFALKMVLQEAGSDQEVTLTGWEGEAGGPPAPRIGASAGNARIQIDWSDHPADASSTQVVGSIDAYIVEFRQGTSGNWTQSVITDTSLRSQTRFSQPNGVEFQFRVRARSANVEDHDNDPISPDQTVHRLGFTSEIVTVRTNIGHFLPPRRPEDVRITAGSESLVVEWEQPERDTRHSPAHAYQVRHRLRTDSAWTESEVLLPLATHRLCGQSECVNPRRYEITGLTAGQDYAVAIRAKNSHGWGAWYQPDRANYPNNAD